MDTVKERATCPICGKTFKDGRGLAGHSSGIHGAYRGTRGAIQQGFMELRQGENRDFQELAKALDTALLRGFKYICEELSKQGKGVCSARFEQHPKPYPLCKSSVSKCTLNKS